MEEEEGKGGREEEADEAQEEGDLLRKEPTIAVLGVRFADAEAN